MATASEHITHAERTGRGRTLESIGRNIVRYGLVVMLLWAGALKFTAEGAEAIQPLMTHSPLLSWGYAVMSARDFAASIGAIEVSLALLIAARPLAPKASAIGSLGAVAMFLVTLSLALTAPGFWQPGHEFSFPSLEAGQLLARDIMLLGAAAWTAGEALLATRSRAELLSV